MAEWFETEPDALHDALATVALWEQTSTEDAETDATSSASRGSSDSSSNGSGTLSTAVTCDEDRQALGSSAREENDIVSLQAEIWRLEAKLRELRVSRARATARETSTVQLVAWEGMAKSQRVASREAAQLNVKLRAAVMQQRRAAKELLERIRQAEKVAGYKLPRYGSQPSLQIPRDLHERLPTDQQWRRLDIITSLWREAFALSKHFKNGPARFTDSHVVQLDEHGGLVDLYSSAIIPFPVRLVSQALWLHFLTPTAQGKGHHFAREVLESAICDDRLAAEFTVRGAYGCVYGKCVKRRLFTEEGDILLVTHSNVEPKRPCEPRFDIPMYQDSWVRLVERPGHVPHTVIQTVRRSCIQFPREHEPPSLKMAEQLARFILQIMETETMWTHQGVENTLMRPNLAIE